MKRSRFYCLRSLLGAAFFLAATGLAVGDAGASYVDYGNYRTNFDTAVVADFPKLTIGNSAYFRYTDSTDVFSIYSGENNPILRYYPTSSASHQVIGGKLDINLRVTSQGVASSIDGNDLSIAATSVQGNSGFTGDLLKGSLVGFGLRDELGTAGDTFQFLFRITDGSMKTEFGGVGGVVGIFFTAGTTSGDIDYYFDNDLSATAQNLGGSGRLAPVPIPGAVYLLASGCLGLGVVRRLRPWNRSLE